MSALRESGSGVRLGLSNFWASRNVANFGFSSSAPSSPSAGPIGAAEWSPKPAIFPVRVQCYCTHLLRLSHKKHGDDVACVTLFGQIDANGSACAWAAARSPLRHRHHWHGGETVNTNCSLSAQAEDICKSFALGHKRTLPCIYGILLYPRKRTSINSLLFSRPLY